MSLESDLYAVVSAICPRVYPDVADYGTHRPYVTWQQVGGDVVNHVDDVVPDYRNALVQINVWSNTRLEANAIMQQIEAAMITATQFQARPSGALIATEDEDIRGAMQDFSIWAPR